ncbi:hypothetical protein TUM20985_30260 [Mycobacterium antarcticum]|nr:hypothetical protein TUM20985_30260 [Mycolicibacterium sp. TUM20985]
MIAAPAANAYTSCAQARAAGAAPLYAGQPGYSQNLDRDGDGVACETGSGGGYVPAAPFVPAPNTPAPAPVPSATTAPAPAATPSEVCYDWMKLRTDPATGEEQVCGANTSPAEIFYWIPAGPMPGGVHDAGSACPGVPLFTFARSTDDYMIWCAEGTHLLLPGKVTVNDPPQPIWALYSP